MSTAFYDAVILGTDLAPLTCGALLAKRGFRVLVVGQQQSAPDYRLGARRLPRHPFTFTASRSPLTERVMSELGLTQSYRRLSHTLDPAYQIAIPDHRFDVTADEARFESEVEREFAAVKRPVLDFHRQVRDHAEASDELFRRDLVWPPESFFERRELARVAARLPSARMAAEHATLGELPEAHPFRAAALAPASFDARLGADGFTQLQLARLYAGRYLGSARIEGGLAALSHLLSEKIRAHSGEIQPLERVREIVVRRGHVTGIRLFGADEEIGGRVVVAGVDVSAVQRLLSDRGAFEQLFERHGEPQARHCRYTLNAVLDAAAMPAGMGGEVFAVRDLSRPLAEDNLLHVQAERDERELRLCIEALLPVGAVESREAYMDDVRERIMAALESVVPFAGEHLRLLDSPHDNRPPWARDGDTDLTLDPLERRGVQTMPAVHDYPSTRALGLSAMPIRTPLRGLLLCSGQVAPGLGVEGCLLAAFSAARVVSRSDRSKAWMRRRLWTKVQI
jgi:phytoene dehydrogenase-like protein